MRVCLWHGWLLEGSGSNVYTARVAECLRREGHDVLLLCQEQHPERFDWIDAWGSADHGVSTLIQTGVPPAAGHVTLLRPQIGQLLPVFVWDEYEGFTVKRFVDLSTEELDGYLAANVTAMRNAVDWHGSEAVATGHAIPGAAIARRAVGDGRYVAKVHGSDLVYAVGEQERYVELAREGLVGARAVAGASEDVLRRTEVLVPEIAGRTVVVPPGVDVARFRLRDRRDALERATTLLEFDAEAERGRGTETDTDVRDALAERDASVLDELASRYDQTVPDPQAAERLRDLASFGGPLIGYIGKLIAPKGVERMIEALALIDADSRGLVIGFGTFREWLVALVDALDRGDVEAYRWLRDRSGMQLELSDDQVRAAAGLGDRVTFTGRLDHRYAPSTLGAMDVLVVPSTLSEAFGMVAAEGAAAGALPLVARHSGLEEVAAALEGEVGRPGVFSFEPGEGATARVAEGVTRLLELPVAERRALREACSTFVAREWSWEAAAQRILAAATG